MLKGGAPRCCNFAIFNNGLTVDGAMSASERKSLWLGAEAWDRPEWEGAFYPPGMPGEWRLTYYNTQFDCVFLGRAAWTAARPEQLRQWSTDTHDQFLFLLEGDEETAPPAELAGKALVLTRAAPQLQWFDRDTDLRALAASLRSAGAGRRYLISRDGDLAQLERVRTLLELMGI